MTTTLHPYLEPGRANLFRFARLSCGLALVFGASGCASHRPAPLLVEQRANLSAARPLHTLPPSYRPPRVLNAAFTRDDDFADPLVALDSEPEFRLSLITYNIWGFPSWMTKARLGQEILIRYTEAVALRVEKPQAS